MAEIILKNGKHKGTKVIVDNDVFEELNKYTWTAILNKGRTDHRIVRMVLKKEVEVLGYKFKNDIALARFLCNLTKGDERVVDHINGNTLDNRRENLRVCTQAENQKNKKCYKNNKFGLKGVRYDKKKKKYSSNLRLGLFNTPEEAHEAYCRAAKLVHGEYARDKKYQ